MLDVIKATLIMLVDFVELIFPVVAIAAGFTIACILTA